MNVDLYVLAVLLAHGAHAADIVVENVRERHMQPESVAVQTGFSADRAGKRPFSCFNHRRLSEDLGEGGDGGCDCTHASVPDQLARQCIGR